MRSEGVGNHASLWRVVHSRRSLALGRSFASCEASSNLALLLLLLLLSQIVVVVDLREGAHWTLALLLVLLCVRGQQTIQILGCSSRPVAR